MYIQEWRKQRGLTQERLAELANVHVNTLLRWEYGTREPKASELQRLAQVINVTEAELLNGPASQEFEVKIVMGVKSLTSLAGVEVIDNSFFYGVDDSKPQIVMMGKVGIGTQEKRENALAEIIRKFKAACWMFAHKKDAEAEA